MEGCRLCPRNCNVNRAQGQAGACGVTGAEIYCGRAGLHAWEEPCISGETGSGTVFFTGCPLKCVYCQNQAISAEGAGLPITTQHLAQVFLNLQAQKAANINLVTPTHYTPQIIEAVQLARANGLQLPIVYNCSGYEKPQTLRSLQGIVDIYLTDFKYFDPSPAALYSKAPDYPQVAKEALQEMVRQQPQPQLDDQGMMRRGVIVRHLLLPGHLKDAKEVVHYVYTTYGNAVYLSLMNQYTPMPQVQDLPPLNRRVTRREYKSLVDYAIALGVEQGFIQHGGTAKQSFIPAFNGEGL